MTDIPAPFEGHPPARIEPQMELEYVACPECGEIAWDAAFEFCGACDYYAPQRKPTEEERVQIQREIEKARIRAQIDQGKCEGCSRPAAMRVSYPVYHDFTGKLIGQVGVDLCVPCFNERHDEHGVDEVYGQLCEINYSAMD